MVRYRRAISDNPDAVYFFTIVTRNRSHLFNNREDFLILWNAFKAVTAHAKSTLEAFVFLPNHLHILLKQGDKPFSVQIAGFKRKMNAARFRSAGSLWQARFWEHMIRDDLDFRRHVEYIHYNPVRHGLVEKPLDWEYSSFHRYIRGGTYSADWADGKDNVIPGKDDL
jgi:putative transposase